MKVLLGTVLAGIGCSCFFLWLVNQGNTAAVVALTANAVMWIGLIVWANVWWVNWMDRR